MSYPSIISQPGSADRNFTPILEAIRPWILQSKPKSEPRSDSKSETAPNPGTGSITNRDSILEIGSYPYAHIKGFAREFPECQWYGSGRDEWEVEEINKSLAPQEVDEGNLHRPVRLDIAIPNDWAGLRSKSEVPLPLPFKGVVMFHCCPEGTPENVFRELSTSSYSSETGHGESSSQILEHGGWIAVYGPYLADDGSYKSQADEEFDRTYIKAKDSRLGLRTVGSITSYAEKWGFEEVERKEMPKGNMWVVWRLKARRSGGSA